MKILYYFRVAALIPVFILPDVTQAEAKSPQCGEKYTVVAGDSLSRISLRLFGDSNRWEEIYEYDDNYRLIGSNPNRLTTGATILLPLCGDSEELAEFTRENESDQAENADQVSSIVPTVTPGSTTLPVEIITGTDYAPLVDPKSPDGGMITHMVREAFKASGTDRPVRIDYISDWGAQLHLLLPRFKFHLSFPWFQPDCSDPSLLTKSMRIRCDYVWSDPIYKVTMSFFYSVRNEERFRNIQKWSELKGYRICRPSGYHIFDLRERNIIEDESDPNLIQPDEVGDCFSLLERDDVDLVTLNRFTGERSLSVSGITRHVRQIGSLAYPLEFRLVAYKDNAYAIDYIKKFNEGLAEINRNGTLNIIASYHNDLHNRYIDAHQ